MNGAEGGGSTNNHDSTSPGSEPGHTGNSNTGGPGTKRKAEGQMGTRSKRNRYISIACNECKRRKIKCNGETPCQRCGNLGLECLYAPNCCSNFKDTDDFKRMNQHISNLQQQVESLYSNLTTLRSNVDVMNTQLYNQSSATASLQGPGTFSNHSSSVPQTPGSNGPVAPARRPSLPKHPRFQGPTSSAFNIGVAKSSLKTMGITDAEPEGGEEGAAAAEDTPVASPRLNGQSAIPRSLWTAPGTYQKPDRAHAQKDPIWMLTKEETLRLVHVYRDEMGLMYPMLDVERLSTHAGMLFTFVEAANRAGLMQIAFPGSDGISDDMTNILKLVLACALVLEASGKSVLGKRMFEYVKPVVDAQLLGPPDCKGVQMLVLTAMYYFHKDEEPIAWRTVGLACRLCMEIGLHRRETYALLFKTDEERSNALRLFWSLYVLDRRWSLGTGMPFAMQDADIDPNMDRPDDSPYLDCMITYSSIGSKVWKSVASAEGSATAPKVSDEEIGYLDYQVLQWTQSIPPSLSFNGVPSTAEFESSSRHQHRLRILLYLRGQQMRILIYRPVLHTASAIMENLTNAHTVVDVAKDTIRVLHSMNQRTDLYRTQQVMFNYFLISALAVLFLGVAHAPAHFAERCRDEFYMALDLVRGLSADSYVGKRLWRTVKSLKEVGPKLGLRQHHQQQHQSNDLGGQQDAHSSAAVAMAGLAGHPVDESTVFMNGYAPGVGDALNDIPNGMANDLTSLFEAAGGNVLLNGGAFGMGGAGMPMAATTTGEESVPNVFGNEDELSRILRDLF